MCLCVGGELRASRSTHPAAAVFWTDRPGHQVQQGLAHTLAPVRDATPTGPLLRREYHGIVQVNPNEGGRGLCGGSQGVSPSDGLDGRGYVCCVPARVLDQGLRVLLHAR